MSTATLSWNSPWTALTSRMTGKLIDAGATGCVNSHRPVSLCDLMCNLDDTVPCTPSAPAPPTP